MQDSQAVGKLQNVGDTVQYRKSLWQKRFRGLFAYIAVSPDQYAGAIPAGDPGPASPEDARGLLYLSRRHGIRRTPDGSNMPRNGKDI